MNGDDDWKGEPSSELGKLIFAAFLFLILMGAFWAVPIGNAIN